MAVSLSEAEDSEMLTRPVSSELESASNHNGYGTSDEEEPLTILSSKEVVFWQY